MGTFAEGLVGVVLDGRYRLDAVLGEGGMGSVFRATHLAMDRKVAIKLLKPHLTSDDSALQRFAAEARRTMRVESPHAVKVLDFGVTEGKDYYMVLEYLDGRTVQRELEIDGPFAPTRVLHIARHALQALGAAHAQGLVHRDVKPDNLLLMRVGDDADYTKVLDFGVAKLMEGAQGGKNSNLSLTAQGMVFGTPEFMSPEQACGLAIDGRSDLYALAATMFAMLTGFGLFNGNSAIEWLAHHARTPPPHLGAVVPELAPLVELDALLQRCLAKRREQRPASAAELDALLAQVENTLSKKASPHTPSRAVQTFSSATFMALVPPPGPNSIPPGAMMAGIRGPTAETVMVDQLDGPARPSPKRGLWLVLGLLAVIGVIAVAVVLAATKGGKDTSVATVHPDAAAKPVAVDAARPPPVADVVEAAADAAIVIDAAPPIDAAVPIDAGAKVVVHVDAGPIARVMRPDAVAPKPDAAPAHKGTHADAVAHIAAAKEGRDAGIPLKELSEADAALQIEPGNVEAMYLEADALLTGHDQRGCQILKRIKQYPLAPTRMRTGGCPD